MYAEAGSRAVYLRRKRAARRRLVWQWSLLGVATLATGTLLLGLAFAGSAQKLPAGATVGGIPVGGLFAAESKFHRRTDASKVALVALVERLRAAGGERLLDVQWTTPHLRSLGARDIARADYLERLAAALETPWAF